MISDEFTIAKVKGPDDKCYWSIMDLKGNILPIPEKMQEILDKHDWNQI